MAVIHDPGRGFIFFFFFYLTRDENYNNWP